MRKNKAVTLYTLDLVKKDVQPCTLTITTNKKDAEEYAHLWLRNAFLETYMDWADALELDWEAWSTWKFFFNLEIPAEIKATLKIRKLKYRFSDVAAIFRMFNSCEPLGCSFETSIEQDYFDCISELDNSTADTEQADEILDKISDGLNERKNQGNDSDVK